VGDAVEAARAAFRRRAWAEAHALLTAADEQGSLAAADLEQLAVAGYLLGRDDESAHAWERAHRELVATGDHDGAARCACWLAIQLFLAGHEARAGGWLARANRLVDDAGRDGIATGYLLVPAALQALEDGDLLAASERFAAASVIAERFGDPDVVALARLGRGQVLLAEGDAEGGLTLFDEVMVAVTTGEVSAVPAGIVYCAVIEACIAAFDVRRAAEWTEALTRWCEDQPDLVPFRGQCLVHRSQILQAHGEWAAAASEAERACHHLAAPPHPALGVAFYQQAELHRLRGEHAAAERAYRLAGGHGRDPAPGSALLRLAEGRVDAAAAAIRRMVDEAPDPRTRPPVLAACAEIMVAAGDVDAARAAADELDGLATARGAPLLTAMAGHATGAVLLASGDPSAALRSLRRACTAWQSLVNPYESARARVLIARACTQLGDRDAADAEVEVARATFDRLGARWELDQLATAAPADDGRRPPARTAIDPLGDAARLTVREGEVLRLVAAGLTNREVGAELFISEHTVARHLQNIFTKTGCSSRTSATAYAFQHGIV
jgi:ATP/maltotriose-dependent transcriptional regulator MalT